MVSPVGDDFFVGANTVRPSKGHPHGNNDVR